MRSTDHTATYRRSGKEDEFNKQFRSEFPHRQSEILQRHRSTQQISSQGILFFSSNRRSRRMEALRRLIADQIEEEWTSPNERTDKERLKCEQSDVQSDLRMYSCEHVDRLLQLQI
ncbi:unnamed protein product [Onchocerca ochengi]|uniref:Homeobox domain-containing protein n=1 Tax=Onchocerca ochengi TaxID=42157 RepID=A0A182DZX2_ONCOC|nr:unnamed protein product [Onchocerca ochengi]